MLTAPTHIRRQKAQKGRPQFRQDAQLSEEKIWLSRDGGRSSHVAETFKTLIQGGAYQAEQESERRVGSLHTRLSAAKMDEADLKKELHEQHRLVVDL